MSPATLLLAFAVAVIPASAARYTLDLKPENTKIQWTLGDVLHTVHGTFALKSGALTFDTESGAVSGKIVVDLESGASGSPARDRRMQANVLESLKFPDVVFTPDRFEGKLAVPGTSNVKIHGIFRIHGVEHEMTASVQTKAAADQMSAAIAFQVPYVAWGMKDPSTFILKVNKAVQIDMNATGTLTKR